MEELNFSVEAQNRFDQLCESEGWTWRGLAKAFARRLNYMDFCEFKNEIENAFSEIIK